MKVTPYVHGMGEVSLAVEASFEVLTGQLVNSLPVIGRRSLNSQVRLQTGEWAVIGGLLNTTRSKALGGFLGQISTDNEDSNVLIGIRPRLLSLPPDQIVSHTLRMGTETRPFTPL
jgi:type II secretory pathway component GspD/PulD (secretin)